MEMTIHHATLTGVSLEMMTWWFQSFDGGVQYDSRMVIGMKGGVLRRPFNAVAPPDYSSASRFLTSRSKRYTP